MYPKRIVRHALGLALLVTLAVLALTACGGGNEEASKPRPLPEEEKALRPGEYRSEEFEPSFAFRVGIGWTNVPVEASDELHIRRTHETGGSGFAAIHEVYEPVLRMRPMPLPSPASKRHRRGRNSCNSSSPSRTTP